MGRRAVGEVPADREGGGGDCGVEETGDCDYGEGGGEGGDEGGDDAQGGGEVFGGAGEGGFEGVGGVEVGGVWGGGVRGGVGEVG